MTSGNRGKGTSSDQGDDLESTQSWESVDADAYEPTAYDRGADDTELDEDDFPDDDTQTDLYYPGQTMEMSTVSGETELRPFARNGNIESASKPKRKVKHKGAIIAGSIVGGLAIIYLAVSIFCMFHFGPNTIINDTDCSFKTVDQVTEIVKGQVADYRLTIDEREDGKETINGSDIDLAYVEDGQIEKLLKQQNAFAWIVNIFKGRDANEMHASVSYDDTKLKDTIDDLTCMDKSKMIAPVDSYAEFNGAKWVAHPEVLGTTINTDTIYSVIEDAIVNTKSDLDLSEAGGYVDPAITTTNQDLLKKIATYNQYVPFSITYTFGDQKETIDGQTLVSWLVFNDDGTASLNEDSVRSWLSDFGSRHDTIGTTRQFIGVDGATYTVTGGDYGWEIDEDAEYDAIVADFENKTSETRDPYYVEEAESLTAPEWGNNYIELNLTAQHMYLVLNGSVAFESDVVTGLPTPAKETPEGVWYIKDMQSPYTMHGATDPATGEPEYVTTCSYFMRVTWTGVAFHDASWQPWFGGDRYTYAGSHGCINMPPDNAATLFSMIWIGIPVIIHY